MSQPEHPVDPQREARAALRKLFSIALGHTDQSRRVADFLLAWHNAAENGAWDPTDLWSLDGEIRVAILDVLVFLARRQVYAESLGCEREMRLVWQRWRQKPQAAPDSERGGQ